MLTKISVWLKKYTPKLSELDREFLQFLGVVLLIPVLVLLILVLRSETW